MTDHIRQCTLEQGNPGVASTTTRETSGSLGSMHMVGLSDRAWIQGRAESHLSHRYSIMASRCIYT